MTLVITPWLCLWLLSSEELKALSLLISSLSLTSQGSGSYHPISQGSVCCDSLRGAGVQPLVPWTGWGPHAPLLLELRTELVDKESLLGRVFRTAGCWEPVPPQEAEVTWGR